MAPTLCSFSFINQLTNETIRVNGKELWYRCSHGPGLYNRNIKYYRVLQQVVDRNYCLPSSPQLFAVDFEKEIVYYCLADNSWYRYKTVKDIVLEQQTDNKFRRLNSLSAILFKFDELPATLTKLKRAVAYPSLATITYPSLTTVKGRLTCIIYTRVQKSGSTTLIRLFFAQGKKYKYPVARVTPWFTYIMNAEERKAFFKQINSLKNFTIFIRHVNFVPFDEKQPIYISMIRDPADRIVSEYYYVRSRCKLDKKYCPTGMNIRLLNQSLENCFISNTLNPSYCISKINGISNLIGYSCGQESYCSQLNSSKALEKAKSNIDKHYTTIGLTEQFEQFLYVLHRLIPTYFKNIHKEYEKQHEPHENKQPNGYESDKPTTKTLKKLKSLLNYEYEYYEFVRKRFNEQYRQLSKPDINQN
ncbi:unnamed protein product [Didymodactylos carnosus]|uniref:Sulfotransferase n=1 Tax=Didymodactylos carnosus TaxID=1234261 RepID=A0A815C018_9BILA|nr:unnamed protein product [Didymodactylos carnosus]CAF4070127.1 unnamed protein product [Didymodactylos carnosus]